MLIRKCQSNDVETLIKSKVLGKRVSDMLEIRKKKKLDNNRKPDSSSSQELSRFDIDGDKSPEQIEEKKVNDIEVGKNKNNAFDIEKIIFEMENKINKKD